MTDLTGLGAQLGRPGLQDLVVRGCHDVWLRLQDGSLARGPAVTDSDSNLLNLLSRVAGQRPPREGGRPPREED